MLLAALMMLSPVLADDTGRGVVAGLYGGGWRFDPTELLTTTWTAVPRLGYQITPRYTIELDAGYLQGLTHLDKSYTAWSPRLNLHYTPWPDWRVRPFLTAGPGAIYKHINRDSSSDDAGELGIGGYVNPDLDLLLSVGPGLKIPATRRLSIRGDLRFVLDVGSEPSAGEDDIYADWEATAGLMFHPGAPAEPAPTPELAEELAEEPALPSLEVEPDEAMVWIPHPICRWVPAGEADAALAEAHAVRVSAPGYLPANVTLDGPTHVALDPAPEQGSLVVLASPGDVVRLGEQVLPVSGDGVSIINAPLGQFAVSVTGGGRAVSREVIIASGYGLWLRIPAPEPLELRFPVGVSTLTPADRQQLARLVEALGAYRLRVRGSASPEGDPAANRALAEARARATGQALIDAGLPPDRILYDPPQVPPEGEASEALRRVIITPRPAGGVQ